MRSWASTRPSSTASRAAKPRTTRYFRRCDAFIQDIGTDRYDSFDQLMGYCRRSADPVGRLLLHLFGHADERNLADSDAICSALQLINHWQDVGIDAGKGARGRIYLPEDDMARFGVCDDDILRRLASPAPSFVACSGSRSIARAR
jgi:phytoene/squalene synthetase